MQVRQLVPQGRDQPEHVQRGGSEARHDFSRLVDRLLDQGRRSGDRELEIRGDVGVAAKRLQVVGGRRKRLRDAVVDVEAHPLPFLFLRLDRRLEEQTYLPLTLAQLPGQQRVLDPDRE